MVGTNCRVSLTVGCRSSGESDRSSTETSVGCLRRAASFLAALLERAPFAVRALQVDGGSEFKADFERACQDQGIRLFVLPPRSPKLNGCVERAQRTHREEFYQVVDLPDTIGELRQKLRAWEVVYNTRRPHQALGYLTPQAWYRQWLTTQTERG